ncbi:MAG: NHL repeat-containing protein [bacterium]
MKRFSSSLWIFFLINLLVQFFLVSPPAFFKAEAKETTAGNKAGRQKAGDRKDAQAEDDQEQKVENRSVKLVGTLGESRTVEMKGGQDGIAVHLAQNSKGDLYVVKNIPSEIAVYSRDGKFLFKFGKEGSGPGQFLQPFSVAIDSQDKVYICDVKREKILVFSFAGEFVEEFSSKSALTADDKYQNAAPGCIAIDKKSNRLYVSDASNGHIWIYDLHGKFLQYFKGKEQGMFCTPGVVCFDQQNRIFVPEGMCDRVRVFKQDGTELFQIGGQSGELAGQFSRLTGVAVDSKGRAYVSDLLLKCVQVFSPEGKFVGAIKWMDSKEGKTYFTMPTGIFIGNDGSILVTDQEVNKIYIVKDGNQK